MMNSIRGRKPKDPNAPPAERMGLHILLSRLQTLFVRAHCEKVGFSPADFVKVLISQEIERRERKQ